MCGIAGFLDDQPNSAALARDMITAIRHRGPDSIDTWVDDSSDIALAHARLAIIDLAPTGAQPMESHSGRYTIAYNGEIYNHTEIRQILDSTNQSPAWRGSSDTETLLAAIDAWGIEKSLERLIGMFAFAIWDKKLKRLTIVRDRFGEKPLYYQPLTNGVLFASELSGLENHPKFTRQINTNALEELCSKHAISAPQSIYRGVYKLLPGTLISFEAQGVVDTKDWWSPIENAAKLHNQAWQGSEEEAIANIESLLSNSVKRQMFADVPLGAFLSGGIDSTLIVALMQRHSMQPVKTFTIGFENPSYNEAVYAKNIAQHLGTSHTEHYITDDDIVDLVPQLCKIFSEPLADSSQIPTYLISHLARKSVTVALTGDAGDEIFAGYNRHGFVQNQWESLQKVPYPIRKHTASFLSNMKEERLEKWLKFLPGTSNWTRAAEKFKKSGGVLLSRSLTELYDSSTTVSRENYLLNGIVCDKEFGPQSEIIITRDKKSHNNLGVLEDVNWIMLQDQMQYLPSDVLAKVDRASMASSLETRAPFLDHTISDFTQTLPSEYLVNKNESKLPLRRILNSFVPQNMFDRPKMGFAIPLHDMIRGPLAEWTQHHLSKERLEKTAVFDVKSTRELLDQHLNGNNKINSLWPILSFQSWHEQNFS